MQYKVSNKTIVNDSNFCNFCGDKTEDSRPGSMDKEGLAIIIHQVKETLSSSRNYTHEEFTKRRKIF